MNGIRDNNVTSVQNSNDSRQSPKTPFLGRMINKIRPARVDFSSSDWTFNQWVTIALSAMVVGAGLVACAFLGIIEEKEDK